MGSDRSPELLFEAVIQAAKQFDPTYSLVVFASQEYLSRFSLLANSIFGNANKSAKVEFYLAPDFINMRDEPLSIRHKKNSSIVLGLKQLKKKYLDAFVSAGNTGALIAASRLILPALPNIRRPALLASLPTETGHVAVVDVGGNVSCKAHQLVQFAEMGAAYQRCKEGLEVPRIGLLNIGVESKKGTEQVRQAYQMLKQMEQDSQTSQNGRIQFIGNIEGREVFQGKIDVLVTDGFTGNVLLKTAEGVAAFILQTIKKNIDFLSGHQFQNTLLKMQRHFNYSEYPGAIILGVERVVIKCHGDSSTQAMLSGIKGAASLVEKRLIQKVKTHLELL